MADDRASINRRTCPVVLLLLFAAFALMFTFTARAQSRAEELQTRFNQFYSQGRYHDAIPLAQRLVTEFNSQHGARSSQHAAALYQLGNVLIGVSRHEDAEGKLRQALSIFAAEPRFKQQQLQAEVMLATALVFQNKLGEGVPMMQRAASAFEAAFGLADPRTITTLNNLAQTLQVVGRNGEAEPIYRKLIASIDPAQPAAWTNLGTLHGNLGAVLTQLGRPQEAVSEARKSIDYLRRLGNPDHRFLLIAINNLGKLEHDAGNLAAADALYRESLAGTERSFGRRSEIYATGLVNLSLLQREMGKTAEADATAREAVPLLEQTAGPQHPRTGTAINNIAWLAAARGDWREAMMLYDRATEIAVRNARLLGLDDGRLSNSVYGLNPGDFPSHLRAIHRAARDDPGRRAQGFALAQRALNSGTAAAVARMAARAATEGSPLGALVRRKQDLLRERIAADQAIVALLAAKNDTASYGRAEAELRRIERDLSDVETQF
ncbi:MAG: tetratricopeptide repeat protein, partial [Hyphomicrobiaceae bacterium]